MKTKIKRDAKKVFDVIKSCKTPVYTFGNGGSTTIANHMEVDWTKCSQFKLQVRSLCSNPAMLTMIANDYGFVNVCSLQLRAVRQPGVLILISSSGDSPNVVTTAAMFKAAPGWSVIGFTGFSGGGLKNRSDISVHINSKDYGVIEDYHSNVMHEVARMLKEIE